ncbi:MAG: protein-tyrosine-phosphatase [Chryseotalea sp.]|jgi:arsenate reductase
MANVLPTLHTTIQHLKEEFHLIPEARKTILKQVGSYLQKKRNAQQTTLLNFICTHNSRRSHISQIWAQAAAYYYNVSDIRCFSGGTEATAFFPSAVKAMQEAGFSITRVKQQANPVYEIRFADTADPIVVFSKKYDDPFNPANNFAAVMTCTHADENCPLVLGADTRISLPYDDPKAFDNTPLEAAKYTERVREIGRELLYAFSIINP